MCDLKYQYHNIRKGIAITTNVVASWSKISFWQIKWIDKNDIDIDFRN